MSDLNTRTESAPRRWRWLGPAVLIVVFFMAAWLSGVPTLFTEIDWFPFEFGRIPWNTVALYAACTVMLVVLLILSQRGNAVRMVNPFARGLRKARYWWGLQMLRRNSSTARVKGIAVLENLARRHPGDHHVRVTRKLRDFIQSQFPSNGKDGDERKHMLSLARSRPRACAPEVQAAARAVGMLRARLPEKNRPGIEALDRLDFTEVDLTGADLTGADFTEVRFAGSNLIDTKLGDAVLADVDLQRVDLKLANLWGADLRRANLSMATLELANLDSTNLEGANLQFAGLERVLLGRANLSNANASGSFLTNAKITSADLNNADLSWADLTDAILIGANLKGANLERANLKGTRLAAANLEGANLVGAKLDDASLEAARLEGALGLTQEALRRARPTEAPASLPPGLYWPFEECGDGEWRAKPD